MDKAFSDINPGKATTDWLVIDDTKNAALHNRHPSGGGQKGRLWGGRLPNIARTPWNTRGLKPAYKADDWIIKEIRSSAFHVCMSREARW